VRPTKGEAEAHVTGVKVPDPGAIVAEVGVDAIGIEQTVSEQLEHWASQEEGTA
jgi:hypothetical protein